jgi:hypothetical protein
MDSSDYRPSPPHISRLQDSVQACRSRCLQNELAEVVSLDNGADMGNQRSLVRRRKACHKLRGRSIPRFSRHRSQRAGGRSRALHPAWHDARERLRDRQTSTALKLTGVSVLIAPSRPGSLRFRVTKRQIVLTVVFTGLGGQNL